MEDEDVSGSINFQLIIGLQPKEVQSNECSSQTVVEQRQTWEVFGVKQVCEVFVCEFSNDKLYV